MQQGDVVGDYRLVEEISAGALTRTWKAEQISIQREVILEVLRQRAAADPEVKKGFVADVRAKAAVAHVSIGAVYEAIDDEDFTFYAREKLTGKTLENLCKEGKRFTARELVVLIEQIGSAQRYLEKRRLATVPLAAHHVVVDECTVRMVNLVSAGRRDEAQAALDKNLLGALLDEMLLPKYPGSTRVGSLLGFMADLDRKIPLTWRQVRDLSRQVIDQFENLSSPKLSENQSKPEEKTTPIPAWIWASLAGAVVITAVFGTMLAMKGSEGPVVSSEGADLLPVYFGEPADGLRLARHEVTIGEYAKFLESIALLSENDQKAFDHPDQPEAKIDHCPDDWGNLFSAARSGGLWNKRLVNDGCPIIGVDWWDAYAYCTWLGEGARLPTLAEWDLASDTTESISGWGKASAPEKDRTDSGLIGMSGNVREWTRDFELNPASPLSAQKPAAAGASFRDPAIGHRTRTWFKNRSHRSDDLGFRVLYAGIE